MALKAVSARPASLGLAKYVREVTRDGRDIVDTMLEWMQSPDMPPNVRLGAATELLSRGYGKPTQPIEVAQYNADRIDFSDFSDEALETFAELMRSASPAQLSEIAKTLAVRSAPTVEAELVPARTAPKSPEQPLAIAVLPEPSKD